MSTTGKRKRNTGPASRRIFYTAPRHWKIWGVISGIVWSPFAIVAFALAVFFAAVFYE
jgi:hypothetical protein